MNDHPENQTDLVANRAALTTDHAAVSASDPAGAGAGADNDALEFALRSLAEPAGSSATRLG